MSTEFENFDKGYLDEITELRERVAYLESYTKSQKDAMRVTMDELATVREANSSMLDELGQLTQRYMELRRTMLKHKEERDALQAKLSAIEGQEPVGEGFFNEQGKMFSAVNVLGYLSITEQDAADGCTIRKIYCAPVAPAQPTQGAWHHCSPALLASGVNCATTKRRDCECAHGGSHDHFIHAQPVNELVDALEEWQKLGNEGCSHEAWEACLKKRDAALANAKAAQPLSHAHAAIMPHAH